jgi:hypothetical protein
VIIAGRSFVPAARDPGAEYHPAFMDATAPRINFDHLDALTRPITAGDTTVLGTMIYADAPGYVPIGDPNEGIVCVDDVARAAIAWLDEHERTGDVRALDRARGALAFTTYMQESDGTFVNFVWDEAGTKNLTGATSRPELGWWTFRGMWALARGYRAFEQTDPALAGHLLAAYERSEAALTEAVASSEGRMGSMRGRPVPAWLEQFAPDSVSIAAIALAEMQQVRPSERTRTTLETIAEGVAASRMRAGVDGVFAHAAQTIGDPGRWHAWGAHQGEALARAGQLLGRPDLLEAARHEVEGLLAWQLAAGRIHELRPGLLREGQQAYGVTMAVRGAMALHHATGEERYAQLAGLHASWYSGNNMARSPMYDPATGRGFDGIDAPPRGVNRSSGAESTIEALMALHAIAGNETAQRMSQMLPVGTPATWTSTPVDLTLAAGEEAMIDVTVEKAGEYVLLGAATRPQAGSTPTTGLDFSIGDHDVASLPSRPGTGTVHASLDQAVGKPIRLEPGTHQIRVRGAGTGDAQPVHLSQLSLHPAVARTTLEGPGGVVEVSWAMDEGRLRIDPASR